MAFKPARSRLYLTGLTLFGAGLSSASVEGFAHNAGPGLIQTVGLLVADVLRALLLVGVGCFVLGFWRTRQLRKQWERQAAGKAK